MMRDDDTIWDDIGFWICAIACILMWPAVIIGGLYVVVFDLLKFLTLGS